MAAKLWVLLSRSSQSNFQHEVGFRTIGSPNSCEDTCEGKLATIPYQYLCLMTATLSTPQLLSLVHIKGHREVKFQILIKSARSFCLSEA